MPDYIKVDRSSDVSAEIEEVMLRNKNLSKLFFKGRIVENQKVADDTVSGKLIYIKDNVERSKDILTRPGNLRKSDYMEIELKTEEIRKLYNFIHDLYGIEDLSSSTYIKVENTKDKVFSLIDEEPDLLHDILIEDRTLDYIVGSQQLLAALFNKQSVMDKLLELDDLDVDDLQNRLSKKRLEEAIELFEANMDTKDEEFWQSKVLGEYSWILAHLSTQPLSIFKDKAYIGGKGIDNRGGSIVDFVYKNNMSKCVVLYEIKTPKTELISSKKYRNKVKVVGEELVGAVTQVLNYKDALIKGFYNIKGETNEDFEVFNPKVVVIIGNYSDLEEDEKKTFEIYRRSLNDVEVVTYDEVLEKIKQLVEVLSE